MAELVPVDHDPFASAIPQITVRPSSAQPKLVPVDHDPFSGSSALDTAKGLYNAVDAGVVKGVSSIVGLPRSVVDLGATGIHKATNVVEDFFGLPKSAPPDLTKDSILPSSEQVTAAIQRQLYNGAEPYKPQGKLEEYAKTIGEFAPGAAFGGGGLVSRAANVVVPAVSSETAGQLTKGTDYENAARLTGGLVGAGAVAAFSRPGTAAQAVRQQLPEGVTPQMVTQAEQLMADAARKGVTLAWPEALSQVAQRPVLTNTMRQLEAAPQTEARMAEFFGGRPGQVAASARQQFNNVAPVNPQPSTIGPAVGAAAEDTVNAVRGAINRNAEPLYTAASTQIMDAPTMARIRAAPGWQEARDAVRNNPQLERYVTGLPDDSIGFLNEVQKYLRQAADNAAAPVAQQRNMQVSAGYGLDRDLVRNSATRRSPQLAQAIGEEAANRTQYLDPLLQGPLGKIAARDTTTKNAINALFPSNPLANSADEIATTVGALAHRNPRAARDLVRAHVEQTFNESAQALQSGANQAGGAKFRSVLVGNPQQAANLEAATRALPNGDQIWTGFNRYLEILEATGTRQNIGSRTAYNAEFLKGAAGSNLPGEVAKASVNPMRGLQPLVDRYAQYRLGRNLNELADILTNPNSANHLRAIARMPANGSQAVNIALRLGTAARSSQPVDKPAQ